MGFRPGMNKNVFLKDVTDLEIQPPHASSLPESVLSSLAVTLGSI